VFGFCFIDRARYWIYIDWRLAVTNWFSDFSQFDVIADILMSLLWVGAATIVGLRLLVRERRDLKNAQNHGDYEVDRRF
jgi:hypothetical protein